jgi:hypothetical protein
MPRTIDGEFLYDEESFSKFQPKLGLASAKGPYEPSLAADVLGQPHCAEQKVTAEVGNTSPRFHNSPSNSIVSYDAEVPVQSPGTFLKDSLRMSTPADEELKTNVNPIAFPQVGSLLDSPLPFSKHAGSQCSSPFHSEFNSKSSYFSSQDGVHPEGSTFNPDPNRDFVRLAAHVYLAVYQAWVRTIASGAQTAGAVEAAASITLGTGANASTSISSKGKGKVSDSRKLDEDEDEGRPTKRRKVCRGQAEFEDGRHLACPFNKRDDYHFGVNSPAQGYRVCGTCSFINIAHLK